MIAQSQWRVPNLEPRHCVSAESLDNVVGGSFVKVTHYLVVQPFNNRCSLSPGNTDCTAV